MSGSFDYFVIFAGMRTGSNFLERNLNALPDIRCWGELFNPYFIAHERQGDFMGFDLAKREKDPMSLVACVRAETRGLAGFRMFHDHDPRVRQAALQDPRCAKIILMRNPVESYVSYKLAMATDQWVLTDAKGQRDAGAITFERDEFLAQLEDYTAFLQDIRHGLQTSGQTAFELRYEDLQNLEVLQGLASFLGSRHDLPRLNKDLKKQNPVPMAQKVSNLDQMRADLSDLDPFGLDMVPAFEVTRGPSVPSYVASETRPLVFMPMRSGPDPAIEAWLETLGPVRRDMSQKDLRNWRKDHPGARSFTVLRHPVARAWTAFVEKVLPSDLNAYAEVRAGLVGTYDVPLPKTWTHAAPDPDFDLRAVRKAFLKFLRFLKPNLSGQTSLRVDASWASQLITLQGFAQVQPPDLVLREDEASLRLAQLAGCDTGPQPAPLPGPFDLAEVYTDGIEAAAQAAYAKDYLMLGFEAWRP